MQGSLWDEPHRCVERCPCCLHLWQTTPLSTRHLETRYPVLPQWQQVHFPWHSELWCRSWTIFSTCCFKLELLYILSSYWASSTALLYERVGAANRCFCMPYTTPKLQNSYNLRKVAIDLPGWWYLVWNLQCSTILEGAGLKWLSDV